MDGLVVVASFVSVFGLLVGQRRLRLAQDAGRILDRVQERSVSSSGPGKSSHLLGGLGRRIERTSWGGKLARLAAQVHPGFAFSDVVAVGLASVVGGGLAGALVFGALPAVFGLSVVAPWVVNRIFIHLHGNRAARMEKQLPSALTLQASALRAGQSVSRSLRIVGTGSKAPLSEELARMLNHVDLGVPLEEALEQFAARTPSGDLDLWVNSMLIHRQTGGNLANVIDAMAGRVTQRLQLRGEIKALTAQGRLSGVVVAGAPLGFFLLMSVGSRDQMEVLYTTPIGWVLLVTGLTLNGLGLLWIKVVLRIKP